MPGRRWSDGLHQAVEAKEGVKIERENQTLATITLQNYFRMYEKLAGMTGTADTEASEFDKIYKLDVVVIPTNRPMVRADEHDLVYRTEREKFEAVVEEIVEKEREGAAGPGRTISIEKSERLSSMLKSGRSRHVVLNAKFHEQEAPIVAQAGQVGRRHDRDEHGRSRHRHPPRREPRSFLAKQEARNAPPEELAKAVADLKRETAEAHEQVVGLGGLHILGTERHESRRIDNQLRGRAGAAGRPGLVALLPLPRGRPHADLRLRRLSGLMKRLGMEEGVRSSTAG